MLQPGHISVWRQLVEKSGPFVVDDKEDGSEMANIASTTSPVEGSFIIGMPQHKRSNPDCSLQHHSQRSVV